MGKYAILPVNNNKLNFNRETIVKQPSALAIANGPTVTKTGTSTTIVGGTTVDKNAYGITYLGNNPVTWATNSGFISGTAVDQLLTVEFTVDSVKFDIKLNNFNSSVMVFCNDEPLSSASISTSAAGTSEFLQVDWTSVDANRRFRTYTVCGINMPFGGLILSSGDSIIQPVKSKKGIISFMGDSYTQGTGAARGTNWSCTLANMLGYQYYVEGISTTGWLSSSSNVPATRISTRLNNLYLRENNISTKVEPDYTFFALGYNDAGGDMIAARAAFNAAMAVSTDKKPIIIGPWTPVGTTTNLNLVKSMLIQASADWNLTYIDISDWVNSSNKVTLTNADNIHPVQAGHLYLARRLFDYILQNKIIPIV